MASFSAPSLSRVFPQSPSIKWCAVASPSTNAIFFLPFVEKLVYETNAFDHRSRPLALAATRIAAPMGDRRDHELSIPKDRRQSWSFSSSTATTYGNKEATVPRSVPVRVARELLQAGHHYLDVRTVDEFSAGHPTGATNVPYRIKVGSGLTKNPNFLVQVLLAFGKDDEIVVGCQSGKRSLLAAAELSSAGFTGITDIAGGYSAWVENRLPTEQ